MYANAKNSLVASLLLALLLSAITVPACGPFYDYAVFVNTLHPDFPFEPFAAGNLGVVQPSWAYSYLVVAYRYLDGKPFSPDDQATLIRFWTDRLACSSWGQDPSVKEWLAARGQVPGASNPPERFEVFKPFGEGGYQSFQNCLYPAFRAATRTLEERIKRFGLDSPQVSTWLAAQDQVFSNCGGGAIIPEPLPKGYPSEQTDRAYQIASAHFYAGQWDEAQKEFEAIGKDPYSSYHTLAPYLAVRVLIRKASFLPDTDKEGKKALLTTAHDRLAALAHEPDSASIQEDVVRLQNLVKIELDPVSREKELAELLVKPDPALYQDLWDFVTYLYPGNVVPIHTNGIKPGDADLADWVIQLGDQNAVAFPNIMAKWKARGSIPWLVAAITRVEPRAPEAKELLEAAGKVPPGSPAYPSLAYHAVRILLATGRVEEAQKVLNLLFEKERNRLPRSSLNMLLTQRSSLAASLEEFLADAPRLPAQICNDAEPGDIPENLNCGVQAKDGGSLFNTPLFLDDTTTVFNQAMPLTLLLKSAASPAIPDPLKVRLAMATFVRGVLLERKDEGVEAAKLLSRLIPGMAVSLKVYIDAPNPTERSRAGVLTMLRFPGLRPYIEAGVGRRTAVGELSAFRDNWWRERAPKNEPSNDPSGNSPGEAPPALIPPFLLAEKLQAENEADALGALGPSTDYLCHKVLEWSQAAPNDPRVPEALHWAVVATHIGAWMGPDSTTLSKEAFQILHKRYPKSSWAERTPYWY